jgi:anti-sigma factor RsiW
MIPICWLIRRQLSAYQDGELSTGARDRVERHVGRCAACQRELAGLGRLRAVLALDPVDPPEAVWAAFWPQVRTRIATVAPQPEPAWRRAWGTATRRPRLAWVPALAACALAVVAVLAPWQRVPQGPAQSPAGPGTAMVQPTALNEVVIQSIETADPDLPVMVYASPESDVTVLWVFGLERTGV